MVNPVQNAGKQYFVLAYAQHEGEEHRDLVAGGVVVKPGGEGDLVEGNIDFTENFQCHGEASSGGCKQLHAHAVERVRVRLMDADGKVNVFWRRFHPMVTDGPGEATPGHPFEQQAAHGVKLSVEVREVVADAAAAPAAEGKALQDPAKLSAIDVQRLQQEVQRGMASTAERMKLRNDLSKFEDLELAAAMEQIAASAARLAELPDQERVKAAVAESQRAAREILGGLQAEARALTAKPTTAQDVQAFHARVDQARQAVRGVFAPITAIEREMAQLLELQDAVRALDGALTGLRDRMTEQQRALPTLDFASLPIDPLRARAADILARSKQPQALAQLAALTAEVEALRPELAAAEQDGQRRVKREQQVALGFQLQAQRVELWRTDPETARQALVDFVEAATMFPGLPLAYFSRKAAALGAELSAQLGELGALAYHRPEDQAKLAAELAKLAPVEGFLREVEAAAERIVAKVGTQRQQVEVRGLRVEVPHAWAKVLAVHGDGTLTARVRVHNEADRPVRVEVLAGGQVQSSLVLSALGRMASVDLRLPVGELSFRLSGVGAEQGVGRAGERAALLDVAVQTLPLPLVDAVGAMRHAAPYMYTAQPEQPATQTDALVEGPGAVYATLMLPGLEARKAERA